MRAPDPDRLLRWGDHGHVLDLDTHTEIGTGVLKHAVQNGGEKAFAAKLRELLARTFRAGHRAGMAQREHEIAEVVRDRVARAIDGIRVEAAKCPHCSGLGCGECGDTGKYRESMRLL